MATTRYPLTEVGKALEAARIQRGLSQNQAAAAAGVATSAWNTVIYGFRMAQAPNRGTRKEITPTAETVAMCAYAVGLDIKKALALVKTADVPNGYTIDDLPTNKVDFYLSVASDQQIERETQSRQHTKRRRTRSTDE